MSGLSNRSDKNAEGPVPRAGRASYPSPQTTNEVLTVKELGKLLRVQSITIYKLIRQDKIPRFRVGNEWRFRTDAVCDGWRKSLAPPSR